MLTATPSANSLPTKDDITPDAVRIVRETWSLTQENFADMLGVDTRTVARWELGTTRLPPFLVYALKGILFTHDIDRCPCNWCWRRRKNREKKRREQAARSAEDGE